jgi:hypothetical protein
MLNPRVSQMADNRTPLYARLLAGLGRPFPNFDFWFIKPVRSKAAVLKRRGGSERQSPELWSRSAR